jgi:hypothetical protein
MEVKEQAPAIFQATPQPFIDRGPQLPEHYGDDKLVVMVRDPFWVFLYWELEGPSGREALSVGGTENWAIRVFCLTDSTSYFATVKTWARNWYLQVSPARRYRFELGYFGTGGSFAPVVSSREVETPRAGPSEDHSKTWVHFFKDFLRGRLLRRRRKAPSKPEPLAVLAEPVPGLSPEILSPPASPEVLKKEYIFRP